MEGEARLEWQGELSIAEGRTLNGYAVLARQLPPGFVALLGVEEFREPRHLTRYGHGPPWYAF